jgi:hypothetical protein
MRIEGGVIAEKHVREKIDDLVSDLADKRRKRSHAIEKISFFLKIKRDGEIEIFSVGTKEEIKSVKERDLGFKYIVSLHQTEACIIKAIHKQIEDLSDNKKSEKLTSLKLTAFLGRKKDQWFFEEIGTVEEMEKILRAKKILISKPEEYQVEISKIKGEFLRKLETSLFVKTKERSSFLF